MKRLVIILLGVFVSLHLITAQNNSIEIKGRVIDDNDQQAIGYATIAILSAATNEVLSGTISDDNGYFTMQTPNSDIYFELSFMGYKKTTIKEFNSKSGAIDLGTIHLQQDDQLMEEIMVQGEKSSVEFKLDKRVFNVGKDISSTGMGALEVLNNVPSVNVDLEGTVSLRGNTGVQMLIDGKSSVLADEGSNALGTITADMIEKIEVITNPSAKYDAEGTSGIINIVLKKDEKKGLNGSVSLNTGIPDNHSVGVSLNTRTDHFNFFTQFGGGYRTYPGISKSINTDLVNNSSLYSYEESYKHEEFYNITLGTDYYINPLNILTLSGSYAYEFEDETSEILYDTYEGLSEPTSQWQRNRVTTAGNPKWQFDLQYKKQFTDNKDHVLLASAQGNFFGKDQSSMYSNTSESLIDLDDDQDISTDFHQANYTFKVDYTNPISDVVSLEAGSAYTINDIGNDYAVYDYTNTTWTLDNTLSNNFEMQQKVLGFYGTLAYELDRWGVKAGLRLENTSLNTVLTNTNEKNDQNYTNLFPSIHTSYKLSPSTSLQAGYSKRIFRPRLWDLNPFQNISNTYNVRSGNPDLQAQYADSYELTGILTYDKLSLSTSLYYLYTSDVIERISTYEDGVSYSKPINVGTNKKLGVSINGKYTPAKWFTLNGDFNYGTFEREGEFNDELFDMSSEQWSSKMTGKIKLPADIDLELTGNYSSAYKTIQGEVSETLFANVGIRKKMWKGKVIANMSVRDIFESRNRESFVYEPEYTLYSYNERGRFVTFGISFGFGKGDAMYYSGGKR